jgi:hypothetical protein
MKKHLLAAVAALALIGQARADGEGVYRHCMADVNRQDYCRYQADEFADIEDRLANVERRLRDAEAELSYKQDK